MLLTALADQNLCHGEYDVDDNLMLLSFAFDPTLELPYCKFLNSFYCLNQAKLKSF